MKKIIYNKFDKKKIAELPRALFDGKIVVVISAGEAERAVDYLLSQDILGVDTETRPSFRKGGSYKVALLQVSSRDICFLFRLNTIGVTPSILRLLEDKKVPKIGLSWHDDIRSLQQRCSFRPGYFIDLQDIVGELGIKDLSLQKLYANLLGKKISKRERLSNWEADALTEKQKDYAATDAWACIMLFDEIQRLKNTHYYELINVPDVTSDAVNTVLSVPDEAQKAVTPPSSSEGKTPTGADGMGKTKTVRRRKSSLSGHRMVMGKGKSKSRKPSNLES